MDCLRELGTAIYIRWSAENLAKRLMLTDLSARPVLQGRTEQDLLGFIAPQLEAREPFYRRAHFTIDAPVNEDDILREENDEEIANELYEFIRNNI